jgi:hypothetical protein
MSPPGGELELSLRAIEEYLSGQGALPSRAEGMKQPQATEGKATHRAMVRKASK